LPVAVEPYHRTIRCQEVKAMYQQELDTYRKIEKAGMTARETEARVLTKGAMKLRECADDWDSDQRKKRLSEALKFNQRIWTIFQADLTWGESPLPKQLRDNLLRLSIFIDKQIFSVMAHPSPDKLAPIIDINLNLASALRKKPLFPPAETPLDAVTRNLKIKA
jgi:flagellar biosynthesis activator protein FlaF